MVFVELMQYNPSVDLHVAITLQLEFLGAGQAMAAVTISPFPLLRLSEGVTLQLLMMVSLLPLLCSSSFLVTAQRTLGSQKGSVGHCGLLPEATCPQRPAWARVQCEQSLLTLAASTVPGMLWTWSGSFSREP